MTAFLANTPVLETEHLTLRAPTFEDFDAVHRYFRSERAEFMGGQVENEVHAWFVFCHITAMWPLRGFGPFIVILKETAQSIGTVGPWFPIHFPAPELWWACWEDRYEGKGLMFEAASAARTHVFTDLKWDTIVSYIEPENSRSIRLAERLGAVVDPKAPKIDSTDLVYRHSNPGRLQ